MTHYIFTKKGKDGSIFEITTSKKPNNGLYTWFYTIDNIEYIKKVDHLPKKIDGFVKS